MVLNTDWAQVEVIDLINDGAGLAFGIIGGRSTGVVVKTIVPGGVADRDGRLQSGDHILQIGEVNLRGLGSEQVASVLRQCGVHVRMVVARPVESTSTDYQALGSHAPIVPTKILGDPVELDKHLNDNGFGDIYMQNPSNSYTTPYIYTGQQTDVQLHTISGLVDVVRNPLPIGAVPSLPPQSLPPVTAVDLLPLDMALRDSTPETEIYTIDLMKDELGLGITVAGYVCEKEEISGIFVKSISKGSAADLTGTIKVNDRIIEVNGESVLGYTNHQAVELLRSTGNSVKIRFERYLRGPKYEQLQQAILANEFRPPSPPSPSVSSLPKIPLSLVRMSSLGIEPECESRTSFDFDSTVFHDIATPTNDEIIVDTADGRRSVQFSICSHESIYIKWQEKFAEDVEIVIAEMTKETSSGLGISLEGTVDVEDGQEVRPHHYIRNILPNGPVGLNNILKSGDELLEVNGIQLLGLNHLEVVSILKQLPSLVLFVCARYSVPTRIIDTSQHRDAFQARNILAGSLNALIQSSERLVKAKSDTSITSSIVSETGCSRSRSLELVAGLAMWSNEPTSVILNKGDHGLGFSILDYQDPLNPNETVIVIRSLIPGGVAQLDGSLIPGDRLIAVNDIDVEHASLDRAVQVLKGATKGEVKITVAKPLSVHDSQHSQDTEDDQTCIDDFQECIEEYQECLEVVQISIEEDQSFNHSPCLSQVEDLGGESNQNPIPKFIEDVSSEPELSFKSLCDTNSTKIENNNLVNHVSSQLLIKTDSVQSDKGTYKNEDSEKDGYETCLDESFSDEVVKEEKTPTNSAHNFGKLLGNINEDSVVLNKKQLELEMAQINEELQEITKKQESLKKKVKKKMSVDVSENKTEEANDEQVIIPNTISYQSFATLYVNTTYAKDDVKDKIVRSNFESNYSFPKQLLSSKHHKQLEASQSHEMLEKKVNTNTIQISKSLESSQDYKDSTRIVFDKQIDVSFKSQRDTKENILQHDTNEKLDLNAAQYSSPKQSDLIYNSKDSKPIECFKPHQNEITLETIPTQTKLESNHTNSLPCLHTNSKFAPHEEGLKSYDHANLPTREDEFFLVQYTEELPEKCQSEPNVLDSSLTTKTYRYRIEEYYNDIEDCLESFKEVKKQEEMNDDEIFGEIFLEVKSKSAPDIFDNSFITLTYDPGPNIKNRRQSSFLPGISNLSEDVQMTVHRDCATINCNSYGNKSGFNKMLEKHWGAPRIVEIFREANTSLGISIVGGKVDLYHESSSESVLGIFIKNVVENSPAGRSGELKTGDRILEVSGVSLKNVSHAEAVETIKFAKSPIVFKVQSLLTYDDIDSGLKQNCKLPTGVSNQYSYNEKPDVSNKGSGRYPYKDQSRFVSNDSGKLPFKDQNSHVPNSSDTRESERFSSKDSDRYSSRDSENFGSDRCTSYSSKDSTKYGSRDSNKCSSKKIERFESNDSSNMYGKAEDSYRYGSKDSNKLSSIKSDRFGSKKVKRTESSGSKTILTDQSESGQIKLDSPEVDKSNANKFSSKESVKHSENFSSKESLKMGINENESNEPEILASASKESLSKQKSVDFGDVINVTEREFPPRQKTVESSEESDDEEDVRLMEGRTVSAKGQEIDRASAANLKRSTEEIEADPEEEDDFGYTMNKVKKKYSNLGHSILMVQLERSAGQGLGLSLAGHKDRNCMAVFVCGINPNGAAYRAGGIQVGDEILEVNGVVLHGRCHLNASAIIKGLSGPIFKVIILRRKAAIDDIAVRPITQFPVSLAEEASEESFSNYPNVRTISIKKGSQSLGIMIIEGKHAEVGQGIFISDIQEGSSAEKAGLEIGEMILAVNKDSLLGSNYDTAANLLKRTEGLVTLVVSNPGKRTTSPVPETEKNGAAKGLKPGGVASRPTTPVPEPPADPSTCPIISGRETTIEIASDNKTIGLCFVGGKDTPIPGGIMIVEVYPGGAAEKDGRLQPADQIIDVNGTPLKDVTHNAASQALRQTLPKMKLVVYRPDKADFQTIEAEFVKKPGKGLGLSVAARKSGKGVYVTEILNGGCADVDGKIIKGDLLISVNGQNIDECSGEEAGAALKTATGKVTLKLHRYKPTQR